MGDKDKKNVTIIVNATPHEWPKGKITYQEVVNLAYPNEVVNESTTYKVSYMKKNGDKLKPLVFNDSVTVHKDMVFNVAPASRA